MAEIDFVITWVDGADPDWQKERNKAISNKAESDDMGNMQSRFRDWDLLKFWFRGVEKFAPWVRTIHFVTWGHTPCWLNLNHPKLNIVRHDAFIPKQFLPTFNSHTIEFNLHRIQGLSEKFVYFNDDMYLCQSVNPEDFFVGDLPCDVGLLECIVPGFGHTAHYQVNAVSLINKYFNVLDLTKNYKLWFSLKNGIKYLIKNIFLSKYPHYVGFRNIHLPQSYLKSTFMEIWKLEEKRLSESTMTKFRTSDNISIWATRYWQLAKGEFFPVGMKSRGYAFEHYDNKMIEDISLGKHKMVCVNDLCDNLDDYEIWQKRTSEAFETLLPLKSSFEK